MQQTILYLNKMILKIGLKSFIIMNIKLYKSFKPHSIEYYQKNYNYLWLKHKCEIVKYHLSVFSRLQFLPLLSGGKIGERFLAILGSTHNFASLRLIIILSESNYCITIVMWELFDHSTYFFCRFYCN